MEKNELEHIAEIAATKAANQVKEELKIYIGALNEDYDHKLQAVLEYVQDIPTMKADIKVMKSDSAEMKEKIIIMEPLVAKIPAIENKLEQVAYTTDATFEKVGEMAEDVTVIKETVKDHEVRLQKIEAR